MKSSFDSLELIERIRRLVQSASSTEAAVKAAMQAIQRSLPYYKWVGVYMLEGDELKLGPYEGAKTEHLSIPVGRGVCGMAVADNSNQLIPDVRQLDNYLACSLETRSEIVVLIRAADSRILGQIDADGHGVGDFDERDEAFLGEVARLLATLM